MFTSAAILPSYFGAGRGGGGTPDIIHAYVRWGCHWTSKCMGHNQSKIKNWKGLLRVFTPYFYWCVCHIKAILRYKDIHYTQTIYLAIAGSTHYSISYLNRRLAMMPIYM